MAPHHLRRRLHLLHLFRLPLRSSTFPSWLAMTTMRMKTRTKERAIAPHGVFSPLLQPPLAWPLGLHRCRALEQLNCTLRRTRSSPEKAAPGEVAKRCPVPQRHWHPNDRARRGSCGTVFARRQLWLWLRLERMMLDGQSWSMLILSGTCRHHPCCRQPALQGHSPRASRDAGGVCASTRALPPCASLRCPRPSGSPIQRRRMLPRPSRAPNPASLVATHPRASGPPRRGRRAR
mmetsp:Transcript_1440/g.4688  ORF Transcript_1440/g.4688 Transcript_1440/m.4688 type:complete len:234 (-) Transcript_1440:616-1317(-)